MLGSSRSSIAAVREMVDGAFDDEGIGQAGRDLLAVADLLTGEKQLRLALSDGGRSEGGRRQILATLVGGQISPLALSIAQQAVALRWSSGSDLVDALEIAGESALLGAAEKQGRADQVEEEIFRFSRIVDGSGDLQLTLAGTGIPGEGKRAIVDELLAGKADPVTVEIVAYVVSHLRGRRIDAALNAVVDLAATRRGQVSAVVRVANGISGPQQERLAAALQGIYGRPVQLSIEIDPQVIGGVSVQVGDEIIDGTLATKIQQARRRIAG